MLNATGSHLPEFHLSTQKVAIFKDIVEQTDEGDGQDDEQNEAEEDGNKNDEESYIFTLNTDQGDQYELKYI